jgi:hypothetical protein
MNMKVKIILSITLIVCLIVGIVIYSVSSKKNYDEYTSNESERVPQEGVLNEETYLDAVVSVMVDNPINYYVSDDAIVNFNELDGYELTGYEEVDGSYSDGYTDGWVMSTDTEFYCHITFECNDGKMTYINFEVIPYEE